MTVVIPDDFEGVIEIAEDEVLCTPTDAKNAKLGRFVVPESGLLLTSSVEAFRSWHTLEVVTHNKTDISTGPNEKIGFHTLGSHKDVEGRPSVWFYVGNIDDFYQSQPNPFDWRPGRNER